MPFFTVCHGETQRMHHQPELFTTKSLIYMKSIHFLQLSHPKFMQNILNSASLMSHRPCHCNNKIIGISIYHTSE